MSNKGDIDEVFDSSMAQMTKSKMFMDAFTTRAPLSSCFPRPAASLLQVWIVIPALRCSDKTHPIQIIFLAASLTKLRNSFSAYHWNQSFQSDKLWKDTIAEQLIGAHTVWQADHPAATRPYQAIYPRWWKTLSSRWRHTYLIRVILSISYDFSLSLKRACNTNNVHEGAGM